jgi:hypothetical protein
MNDRRDPLDAALSSVSRSVQPTRDLWPGIRAEIAASEAESGAHARRFTFASQWRQLAAGVILAVAASATTYVVTRQSLQGEMQMAQAPAPLLAAMPVSFSGENLSAEYFKAREALDAEFEQRIAALPPATRAKLESDLADLRRAANDIAATLAEHPSDPLLQDLLMSTYQSELTLFANVNEMTTRTLRTDL